MRVLLLDEADYALVERKVAQELHCAEVDVLLMRAWERENRTKWWRRANLRKRRLEANRLKRILANGSTK